MVVTPYCFGNDDKEKSLCRVSTDANFLLSTFNPQLVESVDLEPTDTERGLYHNCTYFVHEQTKAKRA